MPRIRCLFVIWSWQDFPRRSRKKKFSFSPYYKSFIDQACSVKMAGYWPRSFLFVFFFFFAFLLTSTSDSVNKNAKKNLANIQPS